MSEKQTKQKKKSMQPSGDITYHQITVSCACGAEYQTGSTLDNIRVDICASCHPFFTGEDRIVDTEGRVEKFKKKYNLK